MITDTLSPLIPAAISSGLTGIQRGFNQFNRAAENIARVAITHNRQDTQDIARSLVDIKIAQHQIEASANVLKANHETLGYLLDIFA